MCMNIKTVTKQLSKGIAVIAISVSTYAGPVNINSADALTLAKELNGVGDKRAAAIVAYRDEHGEFQGLEDLEKVSGVGKVIIEANGGNILLK